MAAAATNAIRSWCFISQDNHVNTLLLRYIVVASDVAASACLWGEILENIVVVGKFHFDRNKLHGT